MNRIHIVTKDELARHLIPIHELMMESDAKIEYLEKELEKLKQTIK